MSAEAQNQDTLTQRARRILQAVVTEYIATAEPVGSRTLSKRYERGLSAATIRNVLSDLEEQGYLRQPHTSAGRVPAQRGFRLFVDDLVDLQEINLAARSVIEDRMQCLSRGEEQALPAIGRMLSELTGAAAIVVSKGPEEEPLAGLHFVPLAAGQLLAVLVTTSGSIENRLVRLDRAIGTAELERVHNYVAERLQGRTLVELRAAVADTMQTEKGRYHELSQRVSQLLTAALERRRPADGVLIEGEAALFEQPEFAEVEQVRAMLAALQERERLLELLDRTLQAEDVRVLMGAQVPLETEDVDLSVIVASFAHAGRTAGTLGVLGPTRMDYARLMPLVQFTAIATSQLLDR